MDESELDGERTYSELGVRVYVGQELDNRGDILVGGGLHYSRSD